MPAVGCGCPLSGWLVFVLQSHHAGWPQVTNAAGAQHWPRGTLQVFSAGWWGGWGGAVGKQVAGFRALVEFLVLARLAGWLLLGVD